MKPESVKNIISKIIQEIKEKKDRDIDLLEIWKKVTGRQIARHTKPVTFKKGSLVVNVDRTSWLYELNLCKPLLIRRLKRKFSTYPLKELRFRIGAI